MISLLVIIPRHRLGLSLLRLRGPFLQGSESRALWLVGGAGLSRRAGRSAAVFPGGRGPSSPGLGLAGNSASEFGGGLGNAQHARAAVIGSTVSCSSAPPAAAWPARAAWQPGDPQHRIGAGRHRQARWHGAAVRHHGDPQRARATASHRRHPRLHWLAAAQPPGPGGTAAVGRPGLIRGQVCPYATDELASSWLIVRAGSPPCRRWAGGCHRLRPGGQRHGPGRHRAYHGELDPPHRCCPSCLSGCPVLPGWLAMRLLVGEIVAGESAPGAGSSGLAGRDLGFSSTSAGGCRRRRVCRKGVSPRLFAPRPGGGRLSRCGGSTRTRRC